MNPLVLVIIVALIFLVLAKTIGKIVHALIGAAAITIILLAILAFFGFL